VAGGVLTKRTVDAATPGARDIFIWDGDVSGFGLKVTPAGGKVYVYQYRMARPSEAGRVPAKRYTIGKHGNLTPDQARKRAKELAAMVDRGIDPRQKELDAFAEQDEVALLAAEKVRVESELAFDKMAALWLDHYENEKGRRPSSLGLARLVVNNHLLPKLKSKPIPHIGRVDLQPIIDAIPAKKRGMRRLVFAYASILFGWAAKRGDIDGNPLSSMAKPEAPKARDRVLTDDEMAAIWNASKMLIGPYGPFYRLLILTGQRRGEVAGMNWAELDRASATWVVPADRAKNDTAHIVPLAPAVIDELDRLVEAKQIADRVDHVDPICWPKAGYVLTNSGRAALNSFAKGKLAIDAAAAKGNDDKAPEAWRVHDLRRTMATGFQRLGVRFEVTEATLNHVSGAKGGVAGIYQRHDWLDEKRSALETWARHIAAIIKPTEHDNVVPIGVAKQSA
jgi:integrase